MDQDYNQMDENSAPRGNFLYSSANMGANNSNNSNYGRGNHDHQLAVNPFHLQSTAGGGGDHCSSFQSSGPHQPIVKTEASTSHHHVQKFHYPNLMTRDPHHQTVQQVHDHHQLPENHDHHDQTHRSKEVETIKAKIISHPQYSNLLEAYMDCQKVFKIKFNFKTLLLYIHL